MNNLFLQLSFQSFSLLTGLLALYPVITLAQDAVEPKRGWIMVDAVGRPTARHEASLVAFEEKLYLLGGRRINPVDVYDPVTNRWTRNSPTPLELHHFQAVPLGDAIYMVGAMNGPYPTEHPLERVIVYFPKEDRFELPHTIPESRRRGGAGTVVYKNKIYIVGGITNGHQDGTVAWMDEYDPATGFWRQLPDAPHPRDHFQAAIVGDKLVCAAGRTTSQRTGNTFDLTISATDIFDFSTGQWQVSNRRRDIPTMRAGNSAIAIGGQVLIGGGESGGQKVAHNQVEAFDVNTRQWSPVAPLQQGRHGSGIVRIGDYLYTASGSGNQGGSPELVTLERFSVADLNMKHRRRVRTNQTLEVTFEGPETSEDSALNPFTDYRLSVRFSSGESNVDLRGFYAADGDAGNTGASTGNKWRVRFSTPVTGVWKYKASLRQGDDIALSTKQATGTIVPIANAEGEFEVLQTDSYSDRDMRAHGRLQRSGHHYRLGAEGPFVLKAGANSPENLLAYYEFDGTYRMAVNQRDGEAGANKQLHHMRDHAGDWKAADPTWGDAKGKNIIGAVNYLSSKGMNSVYFLTMNIQGDGKDVWPYASPDDFTRFDCSKLDQWEVLFEHMQRQGIILHIVTQETENEKLLDGGNTGRHRQLYYQELIARFAHHPALIWNLGEENGPADFSPNGQSTSQQIAMADYFKQHDPYGNTVLIHTHSTAHHVEPVISPLLGKPSFDGLSLQVSKPNDVNAWVADWSLRSDAAGKPWAISMDEIGPANVGSMPDADDPEHDEARSKVLWGSLMAGASGVEWYFGYKFDHNDLGCEDWRSRATLWDQTRFAVSFFHEHLPFHKMQHSPALVSGGQAYCFAEPGHVYAVYRHAGQPESALALDLSSATGVFDLRWYNPRTGGKLTTVETAATAEGGGPISVGLPPNSPADDWVILCTKRK